MADWAARRVEFLAQLSFGRKRVARGERAVVDQATEVVRNLLMLLAGYGSSPVKYSLDSAYNTALELETSIYMHSLVYINVETISIECSTSSCVGDWKEIINSSAFACSAKPSRYSATCSPVPCAV